MNKQEDISQALKTLLANIAPPAPQRSKLSFCSSNKASKVSAWVDGLHATQISHTSVVLYKALPEIHQLKISPENRLDILEAFRPTTQNIIKGLADNALANKPSSVSESKKAAIVALSLQKSMLDGYLRCVYDFCCAKKLSPAAASQLAKAIQRSITAIGLLILKRYQLYTQPPNGLWLRLHSLFQIAEHFDFLATPVLDPLLVNLRTINIQCAYVRVLMLPTAKLNQLSKNDGQALYDIFEDWSAAVKLLSHASDNSIYVVDLDSDHPALYKNRVNNDTAGRIIEISFQRLVPQLIALQKTQSDTAEAETTASLEKRKPAITNSLISHLTNCWSSLSLRKQERKNLQGAADICLGLVDCHQMIGGGLSFEEFNRMGGLRTAESSLSIYPNDLSSPSPAAKSKNVQTYRVAVQNQSTGGFCLLWQDKKPIRVEAGEFIAIKNIGKRTWSLCVVRWINQLSQATQMGLQMLSKSPIAAGAAQEYDMGGHSDYMRVFLCPSKGPGEDLSIITPIKPFSEHERLSLYDGDGVYSIRLSECFFSTSIVKQFCYTITDSADMHSTRGQKSHENARAQRTFDKTWD